VPWAIVERDCVGERNTRIYAVVLVFRDVTAQRQAEAAQRESEERFAAFMRHLPGPAWMKDLQGRYLLANPQAEQIFDRTLQQIHKVGPMRRSSHPIPPGFFRKTTAALGPRASSRRRKFCDSRTESITTRWSASLSSLGRMETLPASVE